jgi:hypothetical protein
MLRCLKVVCGICTAEPARKLSGQEVRSERCELSEAVPVRTCTQAGGHIGRASIRGTFSHLAEVDIAYAFFPANNGTVLKDQRFLASQLSGRKGPSKPGSLVCVSPTWRWLLRSI